MNSIENQQINPQEISRLHETLVSILDEIVRICETFNLRYCLIGGTLIGAVRHNGFIPWDDDLDIVMPREDYDRFCELCKSELSDGFQIHSLETDPNYCLQFIKIRKKGTTFIESDSFVEFNMNGIFVDVFPQDYSNHISSPGQVARNKAIKAIRRIISCKVRKTFPDDTLTRCLYFFLRGCSIPSLVKLSTSIMVSKNRIKNPKYLVNYATLYDIKNEILPVSSYLPYKKLSFEGKMYNVPNDYELNLRSVYGDYMKLPPIEKRVTHKPKVLEFE